FDTSAGVFKAVLFSTEAPQAVQNFTTLAQQGFYNGLTVTRVEKDFVVEAGQGADGRGTTIWNGNRFSAETTDKLHHYSGALCAAADASGDCASVFYVMETLPGSSSVTQELIDQMNAAGWRADVVSAYQTAGGAPYLDYTDTVFGQVYEGMDIVDTIAQTGVDKISARRRPSPSTVTLKKIWENARTQRPCFWWSFGRKLCIIRMRFIPAILTGKGVKGWSIYLCS
ncbi:MAG: peptidylprolyl isomerase, partial [Faecalibacterium sp.]